MKKIGISFAGGGARALLSVGVSMALKENRIPLDIIAGMSAGSLIASSIAFDLTLKEIKYIMSHTSLRQLFHWNLLKEIEFIDHNKFSGLLREIFGNAKIENSKTKLIIYTTDLTNRAAEIISKGDLISAIIASSAIPPLLKPVIREGKILVDGGFTSHFGAKYLRENGADIVIGVDAGGFIPMQMVPPFIDLSLAFNCLLRNAGLLEKQLYPVDYELKDFPSNVRPIQLGFIHEELIDIGYRHTLSQIEDIKRVIG